MEVAVGWLWYTEEMVMSQMPQESRHQPKEIPVEVTVGKIILITTTCFARNCHLKCFTKVHEIKAFY
jgi:hypothetical protein